MTASTRDLSGVGAGAAVAAEWTKLTGTGPALRAAAGAVVIDNSSAWRMDPDVPLVVSEVNPGALREARTVRAGLREFFAHQIDTCCDAALPDGCLITNTATALATADPRVQSFVADGLRALRAELLALLERGQASGEIAPGRDVEGLSQMLLAVALGLNVAARVDRSPAALRAMADAAIAAVA